MRRMMIGALGLALFVPSLAAAQPQPGRRGPMRGPDVERPDVARTLIQNREALGLDDSQVSRLQALSAQSEQSRSELRSLRDQLGGADSLTAEQRGRLRDAMRSTMEAERATRAGIRSVLTMEQFDRAARLGEALRSLGGRGSGLRAERFGRRDGFGPRRGLPGFDRRGIREGRRGPRAVPPRRESGA